MAGGLGVRGLWGDLPVRSAYAAASLLDAVLQCLSAIGSVLTTEATQYVINCLARAALEAGAQVQGDRKKR
jgi:hypothetical protein